MEAILIHHAANRGHTFPAGSLPALAACLEAGALVVEVDVVLLADGGWALLHDEDLAKGTDGQGTATALTQEEIRRLHYRERGRQEGIPVGLLSEAVALAVRSETLLELQVDLKPYGRLDEMAMANLARTLEALGKRARVSSGTDWALWFLHRAAPGLPLGFDPLHYLDLPSDTPSPQEPPLRTGAFGLRDDHPLAIKRWGSLAEYLALRLEVLLRQAPPGALWYVRAGLLEKCLEAGCDWIAALHKAGSQVAAWTLDAAKPGHTALARRLLEAGVDRITTNDPPALAQALGRPVRY